ncbi:MULTISPECIES: TetR/AcrR family transcriptional regulator [Gordonia]|uniref:Putative TetR family transcriptional regulator n=1 Tax=Gordonia sputi NBRC 100414 TaxID=1089453 RepID=H5U0Q5_9ACTN|nr:MULTISPECIES: TetR/AcrR family transcriptional regulator [Gordonia]OBA30982.1 TetR family transcriptional regulator [Gordonia sp. 852002-51296_SCH5728562-b]GAB39323.1 putative TetR family transcriptional regulator [Gordonia sputi NBRC 100414]
MTLETSQPGPPGRLYAGTGPEQRQARRRAAFVDAGLDLFGREGFRHVSVKRLCDEAGLTQRYFYESFADRSALLAAVYEHCVDICRAAVGESLLQVPDTTTNDVPNEQRLAELTRVALDALLECLTGDRRMARVILVEVVGVDASLERLRMDAIHAWAQLAMDIAFDDEQPPARFRLAAVGLIGALTQLLVDWYIATDAGAPAADVSDIRDVCVDMFIATYQRLA